MQNKTKLSATKKENVYMEGCYKDGGTKSIYEDASNLVINELNRLHNLGYTFGDEKLILRKRYDLVTVSVDTININTKDIIGTSNPYRYGLLKDVFLSLPRLSDSLLNEQVYNYDLIGNVDDNGNYTEEYKNFLKTNECRAGSRLEVFKIEDEGEQYYINTGFHRLLTAKLLKVDKILVDVEILSSDKSREGKGGDKYPRELKEIREKELTNRINNCNKNLDKALTFEEMLEIIQGKYDLWDKGNFINRNTVIKLIRQIYDEDFSKEDVEEVGFRLKDIRLFEKNDYGDIFYYLKALILENRINESKSADLNNIDLYSDYTNSSHNEIDDLYYMSHVLTRVIDNSILLNKFDNLAISNKLLDKTVDIYEGVHLDENIKVTREFIRNKLLR